MYKSVEKNFLLTDSKFIKQKEYWEDKLSGEIEETGALIENKKKSRIPGGIEKQEILFPDRLSNWLMKASKKSELSLYIILLAGLKALIYRYSGNNDIIVISPLYENRITNETFNNLVFIRDMINKDMTFKEFLFNVRQSTLEAYDNQDYPADEIVEYLVKLGRIPDKQYISNILCELRNIHEPIQTEKLKDKLVFSFIRGEDGINGKVLYETNKYEPFYIKQISRHLVNIFKEITTSADVRVSRVCFLSPEEKQQLLYEFNHISRQHQGLGAIPGDKTLNQLFEAQVENSGDRVALNHGERHITYKELNKRANRLAWILRRRGIGPDRAVAIIIEPSIEMFVGILGILKAGGGYLPLGLDIPIARIRKILDESGASFLLTTNKILSKHSFSDLLRSNREKLTPRLTGARPRITNLDTLPMPDRSAIAYRKYNRFIGYSMVKYCISLEATRGCPFKCTYCHKIFPNQQVIRSAEHLFEEVRFFYRLGVRRFSIIDDIFNLNIPNSKRFFQLIIKNRLKLHLFFTAGLRGDILTRDYIDLMFEAGTVSVAPALESASPRIQKLTRKNLNIDKLRANLEYICEKYPYVNLELFCMHGFPTETEEEARMTLDFIKSIHWIHFPYLNILRIYLNTEMEKFALEHGITREEIERSEDLAYHEFPETLKFDRSFTMKCQSELLEYFLLKERLLDVLPHQMKILTENELVEKYNSYLPVEIHSFDDFLQFAGLTREELGSIEFLDESSVAAVDLDEKLRRISPWKKAANNALKVLLLDLNLYFSHQNNILYDLVNEPLGLMYIMSALKNKFGQRINGKIAKSRIDFDSFGQLEVLIKEFKPDVIGISTLTYYRNFFHRTVAFIRQMGISAPIIVGGPHAKSNYETILEDRNVNLVVLGEGEITFNEVIENILKNNGKLPDESILNGIKGVAFIPEQEKEKKKFARELLVMSDLDMLPERESVENPPHINQPGDMAYIIYTSGSMGEPKGVIVEHGNVVAYLNAFYHEFHITPESIVLQQASYSFDLFVEEVYPVLLRGGRLTVVGKDEVLDIECLTDIIVKNKVNLIDCSPLLLNELNKVGGVKGVRIFISGGDLLKKEYITHLLSLGKVYNTYGPTETTVCATYYKCPGNLSSSIPIGKPIANYSVYILDKEDELVPIGVPGQLCISGPGVVRGYSTQPQLTAEKFIPNPFSPGDRLYKSGDLARWLPDGNIEFLGRIDDQVKLRGFRVELGEIENWLMRSGKVKEAIVIARGNNHDNKHLIAYFLPKYLAENPVDGDSYRIPEIRDYLAKVLPDYMVPSYFVPLEEIPVNSHGKIDRKALPDPQPGKETAYVAPGNEIEKKLVNIWAEVLKIDIEKLGIDANFFESGGHSLKVTILISRIYKTFNVKIPFSEIFKMPSIRGMAKYIKGSIKEKYVSIKKVEKKEYYELSSMQRRLYILWHLEADSTNYNMTSVFMVVGKFNLEKLEGTFQRLIERHEILRTSIELIDGKTVQRVHETVAFQVEYCSLQTGDGEIDPGTRERSIIKNFVRPFQLNDVPLLRVGLIKREEESHLLIADTHHRVMDLVSMEILMRDIAALYKDENLPLLQLQYKDFSQWQNNLLQSETIKKQEAYWLDRFKGKLPDITIAMDYPRPEKRSTEGDRVAFAIDGPLYHRLDKLALQTEATIYMILMAAVNILIAMYTDLEDIIVGFPTAGRSHTELENVLGMFVNMLPLRNFPAPGKTVMAFLKEVKKNLLETYENQDYLFEDLVTKLKIKRDLSKNPLFDFVFAMDNGDSALPETGDFVITAESYANIDSAARFDLTLFARPFEKGLTCSLRYSTALYKKETIERTVANFKEILSQVAENPGIKLEELQISRYSSKADDLSDEDAVDFNY